MNRIWPYKNSNSCRSTGTLSPVREMATSVNSERFMNTMVVPPHTVDL
jgi:hypothetical protein